MAKGIQSVEIAYGVIEALQCAGRPMSLKDLGASCGMTASKARMYLVSLLRTGLVAQHPDTGAYALGPAAMRLGLAAFGQTDLMDHATACMAIIGKETRAPTLLSMWSGSSVMIVARNESIDSLPIDFRVGGTVSLTRTATGRVFLAYLPRKLTAQGLERELSGERGGRAPKAALSLLDEALDGIRHRGFDAASEVMLATEPPIRLSGFGAIAVPIPDVFGQLRFVMTVLHRTTEASAVSAHVDAIVACIRQHLPTYPDKSANVSP
jgi:DNA-binding IclR family transcriptional regulator